MVDGGGEVRFVDRPVHHPVESHRVETAQFTFLFDLENSDVPGPRGVLLLAGTEEPLLLGAIHGQNHKLERLPAEQELCGDPVLHDLHLVIASFGAERLADNANGFWIFFQHENIARRTWRPPLDQRDQFESAYGRHDFGQVEPCLLGDFAKRACAVQEGVDLDRGGRQAGSIGISAAGVLARTDEVGPFVGIGQRVAIAQSFNDQGRHAHLQRERLKHRR